VVTNPLLNTKTSPVASAFFQSLAALEADLVRYAAWYPYPKLSVAELDPPNATTRTTSWDFTNLMDMFEPFMNATYARGKRVLATFSTKPTWMYDTDDWSYPEDPNTVDFGYARGNPTPNTTKLLVDYYVRLVSWLITGEMIDEYGKVIGGGPRYNLTHWEVFNEPENCHGLTTVFDYIAQYDAIVNGIRAKVDPEHRIKFVGLALQDRSMEWIQPFLNASNHAPDTPIDLVSFHFYASSANRTDPNAYQQFFSDADGFLQEVVQIAAARDQLNPMTALSCNEMGVILPNDNDPTAAIPPQIYFVAAGAMYAYLVPHMTKLGVNVLGASQLAGSPPIPEWDIPDPQYPSVTLVNWTSGQGNPRYWVLKMFLEEFMYYMRAGGYSLFCLQFGAGDQLLYTSPIQTANTSNLLCGRVRGVLGYGNLSLACLAEGAVIADVQFAAFGTPTGSCGNYQHGTCDASNVTSYVQKACVGQRECTIVSDATFGDPCYGTYKDLVIQATCSQGPGVARPSDSDNTPAFAQAYLTVDGTKKVLMVNKTPGTVSVELAGACSHSAETMTSVRVVDEISGDGPPRKLDVSDENQVTLGPYATAVAILQ
ncbi:uncharacterized protein MONBRDRAFT_27352, partial [Monosiga brevicollis MX1]